MAISARSQLVGMSPPPKASPPAETFRSMEEAWFWTMACLTARREGARGGTGSAQPRPCQPDDIILCLDRLVRSGRISAEELRVLRVWGHRQGAPSSRHPAQQADATLWRMALTRLEFPLRMKGIVA